MRASVYLICQFSLKMVKFPRRKGQLDDEPIPRAALRETKEVGIGEDRVEILGRLGPPAQSLSGLRSPESYVVSLECSTRAFPSNNLV